MGDATQFSGGCNPLCVLGGRLCREELQGSGGGPNGRGRHREGGRPPTTYYGPADYGPATYCGLAMAEEVTETVGDSSLITMASYTHGTGVVSTPRLGASCRAWWTTV